MSEPQPDIHTLRCIVACEGTNGPDLYFVKVQATQAEYDNGNHYTAAEKAALEEGYERPMVAFDERDPGGRAMLGLFEWDSASIVHA